MYKLRLKIIVSLLALSAVVIKAQELNNSPYTRYGLGELDGITTAAYFGGAGASVSFSEYNHVNLSNPASYSSLKKYKPVFDVGLLTRVQNLSTTTSQSTKSTVLLQNFALALPIGDKNGVAIGLQPYSTVGYDINSYDLVDGDSTRFNYNGTGGLNRAFIGYGRQLLNKGDSNVVAVGINAAYIFGTIENNRSVIYSNSALYNSMVKNSKNIGGFNFDIGVHYKYKVNKNITLQFGADYILRNQLNITRDFYSYTFKYGVYGITENPKDTIEVKEGQKGKLNLPSGIKIGASITFKQKTTLTIQYDRANWSSYSETIEGNEQTFSELRNTGKLALSVSYMPTPIQEWNNKSRNVFSKSTFRAGVWLSNSNIAVNNTIIKDNGISFGISMPMLSSRTFSTIDLGLQAGQYGTKDNGLVQDNYIKIYLGFSLTPTGYDRWFRKRKYD